MGDSASLGPSIPHTLLGLLVRVSLVQLLSSSVQRLTVNQSVTGASPARGGRSALRCSEHRLPPCKGWQPLALKLLTSSSTPAAAASARLKGSHWPRPCPPPHTQQSSPPPTTTTTTHKHTPNSPPPPHTPPHTATTDRPAHASHTQQASSPPPCPLQTL
jgi:hypothetical protein